MPTADRILLEAPLDGAFGPVVRLIVGGVAERADFGFEAMDDLQLAIERLLAEAGAEGEVKLSFELRDDGIRTLVGPLRERGLAEALQDRVGTRETLPLGRILTTVVDSYGVERAAEGKIVVRLEKLAGGVA
jgi:hypothetical protein